MKLRSILTLSVITVCGLALQTGSAAAQQKSLKEQLTGTWTLVSWTAKNKDGTSRSPMKDPKGAIVFDPAGGFYFVVLGGDLPKLAANDRLNTTPEENKAIAEGTFAYFGTYSINEADKSFN